MHIFRTIVIIHLLASSVFTSEANTVNASSAVVENLSHNSVWVTMQDSRGVMWFGTKEGLNRYDGHTNTIYTSSPDDSSSIGNVFIRSLLEVERGKTIWVGTGSGIYIYDMKKNCFTPFHAHTEDGRHIDGTINSMSMSQGQVWFSEIGSGVYCYDLTTEKIDFYPMDPFPWDIEMDHHGVLWTSSFGNGVNRFDPKQGQFVFSPVDPQGSTAPPYQTRSFYVDKNDDCVWIGTLEKGIIKYDYRTSSMQEFQITDGLSIYSINSIARLSSNELVLGADNGVFSFNLISYKYKKISALQSVFSLIVDREGGLWVGTYYAGVHYLPPGFNAIKQHVVVSPQECVASSIISTGEKDWLWVAMRNINGNLYKYNKSTGVYQSYENVFPYRNVRELNSFDNHLWIGFYSDGLVRMDLATGAMEHFVHNSEDSTSISHNAVYAIFKSSAGTIYIGTIMGLDIFDPSTRLFHHIPQIRGVRVHSMAEDHLGLIWVATYQDGLYCYNPSSDQWTSYRHDDTPGSLPCNELVCLYHDKHQRLFVGTEGAGLCQFDYQKHIFVPVVKEYHLNSGIVCGITSDFQGNLWVSQSHSLSHINLTSGQVKVLEQNLGAKGNYYCYNSSYTDSDGILYFGYAGGIEEINPALLHVNTVPPLLNFTSVGNLENTTIYDFTNPITIGPQQPSIHFDFVASSYVFPSLNRYSYYLEGYEKEWAHNNYERSISYINLPPGKYVFHVKAANNDGIWMDNAQALSIPLYVKMVVWRRPYMILLYCVILIGLFWLLFIILHKRQENQMKSKLAQYQMEKDKEVFDRQITFFTNIIHEIRTPLSLIKAPLESIVHTLPSESEDIENVHIMERNVERLQNLADQLLDFRKIEQNVYVCHFKPHNIQQLVRNVVYRYKASCKLRNLNLTVALSPQPLVCMVDSESVTKITSNLMSNALKYARSKINVTFEYDQKNFVLKVFNDGAFIPQKYWKMVFQPFFQVNDDNASYRKEGSGIGLALVKSLVDKHNGQIEVESEQDNTTFKVTIPIVSAVENVESLSEVTDYPPQEENQEENGADITDNQRFSNTILIVEDSFELLNFLQTNFRHQYNVLIAHNGKEALARLNEEMIVDVIITDIMMPEMDGIELCKAVRNDQMLCHIPIVLLTARTDINSKTEGLDYGADVFVDKPFSMDFLKAQVSSIIKNRNQLKEVFSKSPLIQPRSIAHNNADAKFLTKVNDIIMGNLAESNNMIELIASNMALSRSSLHKKIKAVSGMTPNDYIQLIRLKKAAELLSGNEYQINEIAYLVGFNTPSYFSKCFFNQFGVLPRDFAAESE